MLKILITFILFLPILSLYPQGRNYYIEGKKAFGAKNYSRADELFREALRQEPSNGNPYFYRGYMKEYQKKNEEAIEFYKAGISLRMDSDLKEKSFWKIVLYYKYRQDWKNLLIYSDRFLQFKKFSEVEKLKNLAQENLSKAAPMERQLAESGNKKFREGDYTGAREDFTESLKINPEYISSLWGLALLEMKENEIQNASELFKKLTQLKPEVWEYHYKLGICYFHLGNHNESLSEFESARTLNKNSGETFRQFINISEGLVYLETERYHQAEKRFEEALSLNESAVALGAMARCKYSINDTIAAETFARKALAEDPYQKDALITLSLLKYEKNETESAFKLFETYASEINKEKSLSIPDTGKRVLLLMLAVSVLNKKLESLPGIALNHIGPETAEKILSGKPKLNIPESDQPERSQRIYQMEDYNYYAGIYFNSINKNSEAYSLLEKTKERADAYYILAKISADRDNHKETQMYLKKSLELKPSYAESMKSEAVLIRLSKSNPEFNEFYQSVTQPKKEESAERIKQ